MESKKNVKGLGWRAETAEPPTEITSCASDHRWFAGSHCEVSHGWGWLVVVPPSEFSPKRLEPRLVSVAGGV